MEVHVAGFGTTCIPLNFCHVIGIARHIAFAKRIQREQHRSFAPGQFHVGKLGSWCKTTEPRLSLRFSLCIGPMSIRLIFLIVRCCEYIGLQRISGPMTSDIKRQHWMLRIRCRRHVRIITSTNIHRLYCKAALRHARYIDPSHRVFGPSVLL